MGLLLRHHTGGFTVGATRFVLDCRDITSLILGVLEHTAL